jgi:anti-sigma factor RsiW
MTTPSSVHRDVGAYALGVLDPRDSARFEEHLTLCRSCPRELEELSPVAALLSQVDADSILFADRVVRDPRRSDAAVGQMLAERRRSTFRRRLALAACLAVLGAGGGLVATGQFGAIQLPGQPPAATSAAPKLRAVSQTTGTNAIVQLDPKKWGSEVTLEITRVRGPVTCHLVAVTRDGRSEIVMGWTVPPEGYGTSAHPDSLVLRGGTAIPRSDMSRLEVRTTNGAVLVSVPT